MRRAALLLALPILAWGHAGDAWAELSEDEWQKVTKGLDRLTRTPGEAKEKRERIEALAHDDSPRAAQWIVEWVCASQRLREGKLDRDLATATKKLTEFRTKLARKYRSSKKKISEKEEEQLTKRLNAHRAARQLVEIEVDVDRHLAAAMSRIRVQTAWDWLFAEGFAALRKAEYGGELYRTALEQPDRLLTARGRLTVIELIRGPTPPAPRVRAIDFAAKEEMREAFDAVLTALESRSLPVRRAAVRTLRAFDDPRCVEPLVVAMQRAFGLLAVEIERVLFWFTGLSLSADSAAWSRWWTENRDTWKAGKRHDGRHDDTHTHDTEFYGITSPSKRIVFVVDQSGSMQKPVNGLDALTGKPRPGGTRMASALDELRRAIERLASDVRFNLVFYSDEVITWKPPRALMPADKAHKAAAIQWVEDEIEPVGTTALFDALMTALEYTDDFEGDEAYESPGVNTIFLLTDGTPTDEDGSEIGQGPIDRAMTTFHAANSVHRVVVHTVGVGRGHNRALMQLIARTTGGEYVSVTPR